MLETSLFGSRGKLLAKIDSLTRSAEDLMTPIPGLTLYRRTHATPPRAVMYGPGLAIVVNGRRRTIVEDQAHVFDASHFLLTAIDLPMITEIVEASREAPYLSLLLKLDLPMVRELMTEMDMLDPGAGPQDVGTAIGPMSDSIFEDVGRLLELLETPRDIPILGRLIQRGIFYRVLAGPAGGRLRQIVRAGMPGGRIARAIEWLRSNYLQPLQIEELAAVAHMGVSTLHHQFRARTSMSPLQYQKRLRLHEARRILLGEDIDAKAVAMRVGYESNAQFNREYRRLFGAPPVTDIKALKHAGADTAAGGKRIAA
ncbi:MAG TPA: AraC family transcriptional regulator [Bordetella sp.]